MSSAILVQSSAAECSVQHTLCSLQAELRADLIERCAREANQNHSLLPSSYILLTAHYTLEITADLKLQ